MIDWLPYTLGGVGGVLIALAAFFGIRSLLRLRARARLKADVYSKLIERMDVSDARWKTLQTEVKPLWTVLQTKLGVDLTHPHPQFKVPDDLIVKLEALTITAPEREQLKLLMQQRVESTDPEVTPLERSKAKIMLEIMDIVLAEAADAGTLTDVQLVGVKPGTAPDAKAP